MKKVFGIIQYELLPGVTVSDFEEFVSRFDFTASSRPGLTVRMLKGDRGNRKDCYAMMAEFDSVESRNRFFPIAGGGTADDELAAQSQPLFEGLDKLVKADWTDYATMD